MKQNLTELVFIIDRSGSMAGLEVDTIGGFNGMLQKQKKAEGEVLVTTVLFNHESQTIHDRVEIDKVPLLTENDYCVGGCTALLDAVGETVEHIKNIHKYARAEDVLQHTLFVITTDGMENASREYTTKKVKSMIEAEKEKGWKFVFLGANMDAVETAAQYGIDADNTADYLADREGTRLNYTDMSDAVAQFRTCGCAPKESLKRIREDAARRGGKKRRAKK